MRVGKIVSEAALIVGCATVISLIVNTISPNGIALFGQWDTKKGVVTANANSQQTFSGIDITDSYTAKTIFDKGEAIFIDARSKEQFHNGHIMGAVSFPVWDFDSYLEPFLNTYPQDQPFVVYCSGRECEDGHNLAQNLMDSGYTNIRVYIGGFPAWKAEGYPIESFR